MLLFFVKHKHESAINTYMSPPINQTSAENFKFLFFSSFLSFFLFSFTEWHVRF